MHIMAAGDPLEDFSPHLGLEITFKHKIQIDLSLTHTEDSLEILIVSSHMSLPLWLL